MEQKQKIAWLVACLIMVFCESPAGALTVKSHDVVAEPSRLVEFEVSGAASPLRWRLEQAPGRTLLSGEVALPSGNGTLSFKIPDQGYYELVATDGASEIRIPVVSLPPYQGTDTRFGVVTHFAQGWSTDLVPLIARLGVRTVRDEIYWSGVELSPHHYEIPAVAQGYMGELKKNGIEPLLVLSFGNKLYDGGLAPFTDTGRAAFAGYAVNAIRPFADQIHAAEVWNEYNGMFCTGPCEANRPQYYTAMLKAANAAIKAAYPAIRVVGISSDHMPEPYFRHLADAGALENLDIVSIHPYQDHDEGVIEAIASLRALLERNHAPKPIWATEFGIGGQDGRRIADYLVRMTTQLLSAGLERVYWYAFKDQREFPGMELVKAGNGVFYPAPAYAAYGSLIRHLAGAVYVGRLALDPRTHAHVFEAQQKKTIVVWSVSETARLCANGGSAIILFDSLGHKISTEHTATGVCFDVDDSPIFISGASTVQESRQNRLLASSYRYMMPKDRLGDVVYGYYKKSDRRDHFDLEQRSDDWSYYLGASSVPGLAIGDTSMRPGEGGSDAAIPFQRWISPLESSVRLVGTAEKSQLRGDPVTFRITVDGRVVYENRWTAAAREKAVHYDIPIAATLGTKVEMSVEAEKSYYFADIANTFYLEKNLY